MEMSDSTKLRHETEKEETESILKVKWQQKYTYEKKKTLTLVTLNGIMYLYNLFPCTSRFLVPIPGKKHINKALLYGIRYYIVLDW